MASRSGLMAVAVAISSVGVACAKFELLAETGTVFWCWLQTSLAGLFQMGRSGLEHIHDELPESVRGHVVAMFYLTLPMTIIGAIGGGCYKIWTYASEKVKTRIRRHFQVTLKFTNRDKHYNHLVEYIGSNCKVETGTIVASTTARTNVSWQDRLASWCGGKQSVPKIYYQPDIQTSFSDSFNWQDPKTGKRHKIWISRHVEKMQFVSDKKTEDPESLSLTLWGTTDPSILQRFMETALQTMLVESVQGLLNVYVKHPWFNSVWIKATSKERRRQDTLVLDENLAEYVLEDMRSFFTTKTAEWYHNAGIPYRRGYLLHGPPGCGKTSFAQVLAGELGLEICLINLSNMELQDDGLAELLRCAPPKSMLLLEDVDAVFVDREGVGKGRSGVSFSGLLNALDGSAAQEGCVIVLTTNHKDRLDEALIRPGRCDVHVHIQKATQEQAKRMFCRFFAKTLRIDGCDDKGRVNCSLNSNNSDTPAHEDSHQLTTGVRVLYKQGSGSPLESIKSNTQVPDGHIFFVRVEESSSACLLYTSRAAALLGDTPDLCRVRGGEQTILTEVSDLAIKFAGRIPDRQVSMAQLQGYFMRQKVCAEREVNRRHTAEGLATVDYHAQVSSIASSTAVLNVHELLEVKRENAPDLPIYDHLRRVGLHCFAPVFEHFGFRRASSLSEELAEVVNKWHPCLRVGGPQTKRLISLLKGKISEHGLVDLSSLRDRFVSAFLPSIQLGEELGKSDHDAPPLRLPLIRSQSEPVQRENLVRASKASLNFSSKVMATLMQEPSTISIIEMAHTFQEKLESNGKTSVSLWQLDSFLDRFRGDPAGALDKCELLLRTDKDRTKLERNYVPMSTFEFLRRLGLEEFAFAMEDKGALLAQDLSAVKEQDFLDIGMSQKQATLCQAVAKGDKEWPHFLRQFQAPEFCDLVQAFEVRFASLSCEHNSKDSALAFARELTDGLGVCAFSCHQVETFLLACDVSKGPTYAIAQLSTLKPLSQAESERVREEKVNHDWVGKWLAKEGLERYAVNFRKEALGEREDLLLATVDEGILREWGVSALGHRAKIMRMIEAEKKALEAEKKALETEKKLGE